MQQNGWSSARTPAPRRRVYDPRHPLISLHVPKTAGTSLRSALAQWFPGRLLGHYPRIPTGENPPRHTLAGPICIHGHFNAERGRGVDDYYPEARQFIVFLREPFDRFLSLYFHLERHNPGPPRSFATFFEDEAADHAAGGGSSYKWYFPHAPDVAAITADMASRFVFVGVSERYGASLVALARALGRRPVAETFENRAPRSGERYDDWRERHAEVFAEDYVLYAAARELNAEHLRALR